MSAKKSFGTEPVEESLEYLVYKLLKERRYTLTTAESATGGMIASTLVNVPGISEFFTEGYVTYSDAAKVKMIHVNPKTVEKYGVVSSETACDMAKSAARTAGCDAALSVTGVAGPDGGTKDCPVGLMYIGCYLKGKTVTERYVFEKNSRRERREAATEAALRLLITMLKEENPARLAGHCSMQWQPHFPPENKEDSLCGS